MVTINVDQYQQNSVNSHNQEILFNELNKDLEQSEEQHKEEIDSRIIEEVLSNQMLQDNINQTHQILSQENPRLHDLLDILEDEIINSTEKKSRLYDSEMSTKKVLLRSNIMNIRKKIYEITKGE